jgi:hypothetical protein
VQAATPGNVGFLAMHSSKILSIGPSAAHETCPKSPDKAAMMIANFLSIQFIDSIQVLRFCHLLYLGLKKFK